MLTKKSIIVLLLVFGVFQSTLPASLVDDSKASEKIGLYLKDLQICHQLEWRNMTLNLEYEIESQSQEDHVIMMKKFVRTFLESYSNPMDFWEIMNTKLVHATLLQFPEVISMKSSICLMPDKTLSFPRQSTVIYSKDNKYLKEYFSYTKLNYLICNETFEKLDLLVNFNINDNPGPFDYPDYQWVDAAMDEFFKSTPVSFSKWKNIKPTLEAFLLERFPTLTSIDVDIKGVY